MRVMATLQSYLDAGWQLHAAHELINPFCSHTAELDVAALAQRLGGDFNLVENRGWFVARLRCTRCGRKGDMQIRCSPPTNTPGERRPQGAEAGAPGWR